jgi:uncharacterized delta-60 repeat protein
VSRLAPGHLLLLAAVFCLTAPPASGAALDASFGGGGWVRTLELPDGSGTRLEGAADVAVQPDGRIVVAADVTGPLGERDWVVLRYLPDGRLDPNFGRGGATVVGTGANGVARALALQPDGKVVVTGPAVCGQEQCFAAARLNPDGTLDAGFGAGGVARHAPVRRTDAYDVAVQPDGRIVLAGRWFRGGDANDDEFACVMRLLPDGRLDPGFSRDGMVRLDHGHGDDFLRAIAIQGRRIVVAGAGRLIAGSRGGFAVVRFRPDGSPDRTFGRRGRRIVSFGGRRWATPLAVSTAPGSRLLIAGNTGTVADRWQPAVARLTRDGTVDRGFGSGGRVRTRVPPFGGGALAMQVDARGRVLLAGDAYSDATRDGADWALVRYTRAGRLDPSFAPGGVLRGDFSASAGGASALALAGDRIVAAGTISSSLGVARYLVP